MNVEEAMALAKQECPNMIVSGIGDVGDANH